RRHEAREMRERAVGCGRARDLGEQRRRERDQRLTPARRRGRVRRPVAQETEVTVRGVDVAEAEACELRTRPRLVLDVVDQHRELGALVAPADVLGGVEERLERRAY